MGEPQSKTVATFNTLKATPILGSVGYHRGNNNSLDPSNLNLKLYSPGQETNENINICRAKIGFSIQMDSSRQLLILKILGALNLPARSKNISPDPYVKVPSQFFKFNFMCKTILPDNAHIKNVVAFTYCTDNYSS